VSLIFLLSFVRMTQSHKRGRLPSAAASLREPMRINNLARSWRWI